MGPRNADGKDSVGRWKHGVEQILAVAGMQNQETERKTLARQISTKEGRYVPPTQKTRKRGILSTGLFVE